MKDKYIYIQEDYVNRSEGYRCGQSDVYQTWATVDQVGALFKDLQKQFGRCISKMYHDNVTDPNGKNLPIGWVFQKRRKYEDSSKTYLQEVWVTLHDAPPTKTIEYHYKPLKQ